MAKKGLTCSFCGASQHDAKKLIAGPGVNICDGCIELCDDVIHDRVTKKALDEAEINGSGFDPQILFDGVSNYVIGQDRLKKILAVAFINHLKRLQNNGGNPDVRLSKSNLLITGPTGTGKTLTTKRIAQIAGVPFVEFDCTQLTKNSTSGNDVKDVLESLVAAANGDFKLAERGIIFLGSVLIK